MTSATATETNNTAEQPKPAETSPAADAAKPAENNADSGDQSASPSKKPAAPKPTVHKVDWEENMVYLYQFTRCPTIPSVSPFCLKVETFLRMTGIKYEVSVAAAAASHARAAQLRAKLFAAATR